jgi:hypothetical protein
MSAQISETERLRLQVLELKSQLAIQSHLCKYLHEKNYDLNQECKKLRIINDDLQSKNDHFNNELRAIIAPYLKSMCKQ